MRLSITQNGEQVGSLELPARNLTTDNADLNALFAHFRTNGAAASVETGSRVSFNEVSEGVLVSAIQDFGFDVEVVGD